MRNIRNVIKKLSLLVSSIVLVLFVLSFCIKVKAADKIVIKIDLDKGSVFIDNTQIDNSSNYNVCSGFVTNLDELDDATKAKFTASGTAGKYTWTHSSDYSYYIYQSNNEGIDGSTIFSEALEASDFKDVEAFANKCDEIATSKGMKAANGTAAFASRNRISIEGINTSVDVVLHNVWSTYANGNYAVGSLDVNYKKKSGLKVTVKLQGHNRFHRIGWYSNIDSSSLTFENGEIDENKKGCVVVVGDQTKVESSIGSIKYPRNHWDSAIGGTDAGGYKDIRNIIINSGIVYSGTTPAENCSAIGGGGNGYGAVTINGGDVYAVCSAKGTAIGGGIGHQSYGGNCNVIINGGNIKAYNFGQPFDKTMGSARPSNVPVFVPGTAIGGGSSIQSNGNSGDAKVTINGGNVEAFSVAGSAIGGGNSVTSYGGKGVVTINGGIVKATSVPTEEFYTTSNYDMGQGTGIGGGSSNGTAQNKRDGGKATVTITGGRIEADGIGGGTSKNGDGGYASVTVTGGTLDSESIGGGLSQTNGYAYGDVTVTGGSMNSTVSTVVMGVDNKEVFLTRASIYFNDIVVRNKKVDSVSIDGITGVYGQNDIYVDNEGYIYLWIPENSGILDGVIDENTYLPLEEVDSKINVTDLGILKYESPLEHCYINIAGSNYYTPSLSDSINDEIIGYVILEKNVLFKYYLIADKSSYEIIPYHAVSTDSGKIFQMGNMLTKVDGKDNVYESQSMTIAKDTQIIFNIRDTVNNTSFYTFDLTKGNINVTEGDNNTISIEQDGYVLNISKNDGLYITSGGYPTNNKINFNVSVGTELDVIFDRVNLSSDESPINIKSGTMNASFSEEDNMIISTGGSAINVEENGRINITSNGKESIKLEGASGMSAITGEGTVCIEDNGGFLKINTLHGDVDVPQISVGTYIYKGTKQPTYTANIYGGEFTFEVIGYVDKDGNLKAKSDLGNDNINDFTARGIFKIFTEVSCKSEGISSGNYVMVLKATDNSPIGPITLKRGNTILEEGTHYSVSVGSNNEVTLTIFGSSFKEDNISIMAAKVGYIPYVSDNYSGYYDGEKHNIVLIYNEEEYTAYYSTVEITTENFNEVTKTINKEELSISDVDKVTIYWYIIPKVVSDDSPAATKGSNYIEIKKATNKWDEKLVCLDIAVNNFINPKAIPRFGEVEYQFIKLVDGVETPLTIGNEYTIVDGKFKFTVEGTYYIKAVVDETTNYTGLDSGYIRFKVIKIAVFTSTNRNLDEANGAESTIGITSNGAFAIRYEFLTKSDMAFTFINGSGKVIPKGTKFTLIVFNDTNREYYYYNYEGEEDVTSLVIELTSFQKMGTIGNTNMFAEPNAGTSSNYQLAVDLPFDAESNQELTVKFNALEGNNVIVHRNKNLSADFTSYTEPVSEYDDITLDVTISSNAGGNDTILAFTTSGVDLDYCNAVLNSSNSTYYPFINGNVIFFNLGNAAINNEKYTLVISNINTSELVKITSDVRFIESTDDIKYSLSNRTSTNCIVFDDVAVNGKQVYNFVVNYNDSDYLVITGNNERIVLTVNAIDNYGNKVDLLAPTSLKFKLYKYTDNGYSEVILPIGTISLTEINTIIIPGLVNVSSTMELYKVELTYQGEVTYFTFWCKKA